jgi:hypothetical protein
MHADNCEDSATKPAARPPGVRAARRQWAYDRRTATSQALEATMKQIAQRVGAPFDLGDALLKRCAELALCAQTGRRHLIEGREGVDIDLLLRLEGCARRALADFVAARRAAQSANEPSFMDELRRIAEVDP